MLDLGSQKKESIPLTVDQDGVVRVGGTRVSLLSVLTAFQYGASAEVIGEKFPALDLPDIYAVITFYLRHRQEVDTHLAEERARGDQITQEIETEFPSTGLRTRLLRRWEKRRS